MAKRNTYLSNNEEALILYALKKIKKELKTDRDKSTYFGLLGKLNPKEE